MCLEGRPIVGLSGFLCRGELGENGSLRFLSVSFAGFPRTTDDESHRGEK